jgi:chromosome segregation ATPase
VALGALTADVAAEVERLRAQHADAVREKSAAESKSRRLAEKVAALEGERTDLRRQLVEERREANQAIAAAQAEAKLARAEGSVASQRAEEWEVRFNALQARMERVEASTRSEVERTCKQLVDSYRELGA